MTTNSVVENFGIGLILEDSKTRIKMMLEKVASRSRAGFSNPLVVKTKTRSCVGALEDGYRIRYWAIVERIPVNFCGFTFYHVDKEVLGTDFCVHDGGYMQLEIYSRSVLGVVIEEIKSISAHYPHLFIRIQKHFRPTVSKPDSLIAEDALL